MATSYLWVHVREARVSEPDPNNHVDVQVTVRVGSIPPITTPKAFSPNPKWDQDIMLTLNDNDMMGNLTVELFRPKFFFRTELLGVTTIPLITVRHSNKPNDGFWVNLFLTSNDVRVPTQHQIRLDTHFELPKDIPPDVVALLEKKLETFNTVLEDEVEALESQEHRIVTGSLTPPSIDYELRESQSPPPSQEQSASQSPPPSQRRSASRSPAPRQQSTSRSPAHRLQSASRSPAPRQLSASCSPVPIQQKSASRSPLRIQRQAPIQQSPTPVRRHSPIERQSTAASDGSAGVDSPPAKVAVSRPPALPRSSEPSPDFIDGGYPTHSPDLDQFKNFDWIRNSLTPERNLPLESSVQAALKNPSSGSALDSKHSENKGERGKEKSSPPPLVISDGEHNEGASARTVATKDSPENGRQALVRSRWQNAVDHYLPEIRRELALKRPSFPELGGNRSLTLVQLVDQLKSYKMKSKLIEQNVETFSTANSKFRSRSRSVLDVKRKNMYRRHYIDEKVRMNVFKRTMEALLYPASEPDSHLFVTWSARKPTSCSQCTSLLWGLVKQGVKCTRCGKICHERCATLCSQDCFIDDQRSAIMDKMQRMLVNHSHRFETLRQAFNVPHEQYQLIKDEVESRILKIAENFNAEISITVLAVQGLLYPKTLNQRIYVSVAVGNEKKKTEVFKRRADEKTPPSWNEEFMFTCSNYHDAIQLRVWNERDSAMAKVATTLTKEGDLFLGQKIIEVQRTGASQEVWYKLEKRTEKGNDVAGHIKVNISVTIEGESLTPFHVQYIKLHEQMFFHCHVNNDKDLVIFPAKMSAEVQTSLGRGPTMQLLPPVAQEIVDEFALRYAIEPIFRMMLHIELLVNHHSVRNALLVISNMLKNLKYQMFIHVAADHAARAVGATALMEEYMDASNFGRDKFSRILDKLLNSLRLDLQQYREFYPHNNDQKLSELVQTFELMGTVIEFQQQAMGILSTNKASELILENMKECLKNTFEFIVQSNVVESCTGHPALDTNRPPFDFFYQIIMQMKSVILEDRTVYGKFITKYCNVNFGDVSALELWHLFSSTIEGLFDADSNLEVFSPNDYITLLFTIKSFYDSEVGPISIRQGRVPEYPRWFVKCVQRWLLKYQKDGMFFVDNAWDDDKTSLNFAAHENQNFSSSVFQMFFYLHQGLEFVMSLESGDNEVKELHFEDFSNVIISIVQHYVDKVSMAIPEYTSDLEIMCMLLNNLQALRANIHRLFEEMGGAQNTGPGASKILTEFQQVLTKQVTSWCGFVARSLNSNVLSATKSVQDQLIKIRSQGSAERGEVKEVVRPLFDLLADRLRVIATRSEQFVFQKVVKEVWYVCLESLHHMLLPMLKWEHDGVQASPSINFPLHHYSPRHCASLEIMVEILRDFFKAAESQGIKMSTIDRGIKQLKSVICLYRETTEMLITDFIVDETRNGVQATGASYGEVYLEVDAYCHPSTGELEGTIRVVSAVDLKGFSGIGALKPLIELNVITPTVSSSKRKFVTQSKSTNSPNFNETFKFTILGNWENSELLVIAKHRSTFNKDKVIGISVVPCNTLNEQPSLTVSLSSCLSASDRGRAILNVLSVRSHDEFAKEFVALKMMQRYAGTEEVDDLNPQSGHKRNPSLLSSFLK